MSEVKEKINVSEVPVGGMAPFSAFPFERKPGSTTDARVPENWRVVNGADVQSLIVGISIYANAISKWGVDPWTTQLILVEFDPDIPGDDPNPADHILSVWVFTYDNKDGKYKNGDRMDLDDENHLLLRIQ